jgi:acetoacetyl-CoA synthetase
MSHPEPIRRGEVLWRPSEHVIERANVSRYMNWLRSTRDQSFTDYLDLWRWSVTEVEAFWQSLWDYFGVHATRAPDRVLSGRRMPDVRWFEGAELNYAEHALRRTGVADAVVYACEDGTRRTLDWDMLRDQVARARAGLVRLGVGRGDRVAAFLPNAPETLVAFLATASLGAIWSSVSPEFGVASVLDRFSQIEPKVLLAVDGYVYGGKVFDRVDAVEQVRRALPTVRQTVLLSRRGGRLPDAMDWEELLAEPGPLTFEPVPFDHPLWVLYSSGTTGLPKPIVHSQGGILLEHLKVLSLHCDLGENDRFFWFTTTGWMMWNFLVGGLLVGSTIVLYEGSPGVPDLLALWRLAEETEMTYFGTSAPYLMACRKEGIRPLGGADLSGLRAVGSTGAPLPVEGFEWVYHNVSRNVLLGSVSGGTDVCTAFVTACPLLPVRAGELQCNALGAKVEAFGPAGQSLVGEVGELVITEPMPSMPVCFWNDPDGERLRAAYFDTYPGVWRHGDWIELTEDGSSIIYGRSDSTLNRGGVRMGTSEFYRVVEELPEIADSLVVDTGSLNQEGKLWLFVVPAPGCALDEALLSKLRATLRAEVSPRHVPDVIVAIAEVPKTINGKKLEVPLKRILSGTPPEDALNPDTLANPAAVDRLLEAARRAGA